MSLEKSWFWERVWWTQNASKLRDDRLWDINNLCKKAFSVIKIPVLAAVFSILNPHATSAEVIELSNGEYCVPIRIPKYMDNEEQKYEWLIDRCIAPELTLWSLGIPEDISEFRNQAITPEDFSWLKQGSQDIWFLQYIAPVFIEIEERLYQEQGKDVRMHWIDIRNFLKLYELSKGSDTNMYHTFADQLVNFYSTLPLEEVFQKYHILPQEI